MASRTTDDKSTFVATDSFVTEHDGQLLFVQKGELIKASHPVADAHRRYFRLLEDATES